MRVLFVQPNLAPNYFGVSDRIAILEPLNLEYLASGIKDFCDPFILDMRFDPDLEKTLEALNPDVVGVTGYAAHGKIMKNIIQRVKRKSEKIMTVAGGIFVTSFPSYFNDSQADILVIGEGVFPLKEILWNLGRGVDLSAIAGIALRKNGQFFIPRPRPHPPIDDLPFPDRSLTKQHRNEYFMPIFKPTALLRTSLGCVFKCNFCLQHKLSGGRYLGRKPELVVEEMKMIPERNITLADDETFLQIERVSHLADLIKKERIYKRYHAFIRADTVVRHREVLEKWKDIGLSRLLIGFESFKEEDLRYYGKKASSPTNEKAIQILNDMNLDYTADFIIRPEYDRKDFQQLREYVRRMGIRNPAFPVLTPYPGTDLFEEKKDFLLSHDYELYDQNHSVIPTKLPMEEFYAHLAKIRRSSAPRRRMADNLKMVVKMSKKEIWSAVLGRIRAERRISQMKKLYKDLEK